MFTELENVKQPFETSYRNGKQRVHAAQMETKKLKILDILTA